jgi:DNA-binding IclR family transcriptional regulator
MNAGSGRTVGLSEKGARKASPAARPADEADVGGTAAGDAVKSLRKALNVMNVLAEAAHPQTMAQIALTSHIARPTAYRLVKTLVQEGFVQQNPVDGRLTLGYAVLPLAASVLDGNRIRLEAMPHLEALAKQTGERVNLGILYNNKVLFLAGIEKPSLPTLHSRFGRTVPAHCSSLGKAILAFLSEEEVHAHLGDAPLTASTRNSIVSQRALSEELEETRSRGYAIDNQESVTGTACVGMAIFDQMGRPVASISISGKSLETLGEKVGALRSTAERIAHGL